MNASRDCTHHRNRTSSISAFQVRCLQALAKLPMQTGSADDIAYKIGMGRSGRLAVTSAMWSLTKKDNHGNPEVSEWITRLAPRDQWSAAKWCANDKAMRYLGYVLHKGAGWVSGTRTIEVVSGSVPR